MVGEEEDFHKDFDGHDGPNSLCPANELERRAKPRDLGTVLGNESRREDVRPKVLVFAEGDLKIAWRGVMSLVFEHLDGVSEDMGATLKKTHAKVS